MLFVIYSFPINIFAQQSGTEVPIGESNEATDYLTIKYAALLPLDGPKIDQVYFHSRKKVDPFILLLSKRLGKFKKNGNSHTLKNIFYNEWHDLHFDFTVEVLKFPPKDSGYYSVTFTIVDNAGKNLLKEGSESHAVISKDLQRMVDKTLR